MDSVKQIDTINDLHDLFGYEGNINPYVSLINLEKTNLREELRSLKFSINLYTITMKDNKDCWLKYGRQVYDFSAGSLLFTAPGQVFLLDSVYDDLHCEGWMLCFHPDLIRNSHVEDKMSEYTYFSYDTYEALHLSSQENNMITEVINNISKETALSVDTFSQSILLSYLEVLLSYSSRFYARQFETRSKSNKDYLIQFEEILRKAFSEETEDNHIPSVKEIANMLGYSPNYLSDMLKKETGQTASEYIQKYMVDKAKSLLINKEITINEISIILGFEQQANFSKFFKGKTGQSPSIYRKNH
ncbi:AraC family transcriptional regulator [Acidaminobacter sp. JC074]|uniref:helix-turn-helix domain-containing protein n=1 Tax=Acidaminobacter sp. JC074 TaxID=2530199 RepID=UPI001F102720|nr:AraC family transcriptional regulator [Acidaminobacter sp. JC074]